MELHVHLVLVDLTCSGGCIFVALDTTTYLETKDGSPDKEKITSEVERIANENVTACVDVQNIASILALRSSGFIEIGRYFDWRPNPLPRKTVEFVLPK